MSSYKQKTNKSMIFINDKEKNFMYKIMKIFFLFSLFISLNVFAAETSPWDKGQAELGKGSSGILPNVIRNWFDREREQWGYNPRFMPAAITFNSSGYVFMRVGVPDFCITGANKLTYPSRFWSEKNYIQFKTSKTNWQVSTAHVDAIRNFLGLAKDDKLFLQAGERVNDSVESTPDGGVITLCNVNYTKAGKEHTKSLVLYSPSKLQQWQVKEFDGIDLKIAPYRTHADHSVFPVLTAKQKGIIICIPKIVNGKLDLSKTVKLVPNSDKPVLHSTMSGAGARCITVGGKTFVVYMSMNSKKGKKGSPQYIVEYDHSTGKINGPVFIGTTGHKVDGHNAPVIDVDSKGFLHVIGGAHWHPLKHWKSPAPYSIVGKWSLDCIAGKNGNLWSRNGLTYPGFIIDENDTMHLVCRGRNSKFVANDPTNPNNKKNLSEWLDYALVYLRKKPGKSWEMRKDIAVPQWRNYSNWYHKVGINPDGNKIFITYYYYASWLKGDVRKEYEKRWGSELPKGAYSDKQSRAHDPALAVTVDGGNTWKLAKSSDLFK